MSSSTWKLRALLKKNFLVLRRNIISTLCEILFPILGMLLLYFLKIVFEIKNYEFNIQEGSLQNYIKNHSVFNSDTFPPYNITKISNNIPIIEYPEFYGMSMHPSFNICSIFNSKHKIRKLIATIGVPEEIKLKLIQESLYFFNSTLFYLTKESFKDFETEEELEKYIKSKSYGESEENPLICFGISFSKDEINHKYDYSLHYFEKEDFDGASDVPRTPYIMNNFLSRPNWEAFDKYQTNGYSFVMKVINDYIYSQEISNETKINFGIIPMKYQSYKIDTFGDLMGIVVAYFIVVAYLGHLCLYFYRMVQEKETKVKEGMKIMGLTDGIYFLSYFIQYIILSLIVSLINTLIFLIFFKKIPFIIFFLIFFLYSLNVFALAFFFQSFSEKAKESLLISVIIYFIMFIFHILFFENDASFSMKTGLSIFPQVALYLGFQILGEFESNFRQFYSKDAFCIYDNYSIITMYIMLIADILIYLFLGYYFQNILPHEFGIRKPWYFLCTKKYWSRKIKIFNKNNILINEEDPPLKESEELILDVPLIFNENENFQTEEIYKEMNGPKDVLKIREIVKKFDDGKIAVNHVSLNLYKNEIFALLGHNGAGKTTLISMLTGLYEATEGEVIYDNMNILLPENIADFRGKIGICPQHDVLFNDLTIRDHLSMFAVFKGVSSQNLESEINKIIHDFQLEEIQYTLARNLSAGQRRKLSIAISLVGGSEIIFLDEPSSGMDITSRRNLWEILKRQCDNKIIILTTHYMEEASVLGKRIGIINLGKMKCVGTPLFLIEKFGKYININFVKEEGEKNDNIYQFITKYTFEAKFESLSEEILVRIPKDIFSNNNKDDISIQKFFEDLDSNLTKLKIKSYAVSMPTLEDVFLNLAQEENNRFSYILGNQKENDRALFDLNYLDTFTRTQKFFSDLKSNFIRRFYLTIREKKGLIMEIFCPILLVLMGCVVSKFDSSYSTPAFGAENLPDLGKQTIFYSSLDKDINKENIFIKNMINVTSANLTLYDTYSEEIENNKTLAIQSFTERVFNSTKESESSIDNDLDLNDEYYRGYYGHILILNKPNEENKNYEFVELINPRINQGVPLYTSAFLERIIKNASNNKVKINYKHKVMPKTLRQENEKEQISNSVGLFISIAYALIPTNFIAIIVRERNNNSKHLMKLSGMNIFSYWVINFLFEIIKFYFTGGICLLIIYLFSYYTPYLIHFYFLYGPSLILMTYILSFLFKDELEAQNAIILLHSLAGAIGSIMIVLIREVERTKNIGKVIEFFLCLVPSFIFGFAYNLAQNKYPIYKVDYPDKFLDYIEDDNILMQEFFLLKGPFYFLLVEIFIYLLILILIEVYSTKEIFSKNEIPVINEELGRDSGVIKEEEKAQSEKKKIGINDNNYVIRVKNLQKEYKSILYKLFPCFGKDKGKIAIKNLSFCLEKGECFGLLGLNGAGKTTTFKCITQEIIPSNGEIFLNGIKTNNNFDLIKNKFGYCPQYDAIFEYMTVFENLEFYAKLKGVKKDFLLQIVNAVIYEMKLEEFIKKPAGRLSGGNKRKLSVAISLLCNSPIILLDEPSSGMDPESRRFMWSIIHKVSKFGKKSSIIMTTHSMDEAEALCKRMGIMVNGEFVCLGKANEIKSKYGNKYELNLRIKPMTEELKDKLFFEKYNLDKKLRVRKDNIDNILEQINKINYKSEIREGRLGAKLIKDMEKGNGISINSLLNWIFYVQNAFKLIQYGKDYFSRIIIEENMDNSFLFRMNKNENNNKSIGYLFGLFEAYKEECHITEYSIQQTSLEQIFNKFSENQISQLKERNSTIVEKGDVENIAMDEMNRRKSVVYDKIVVNDELFKKLLNEEYICT